MNYFLIGVTALAAILTVREAWRAGGADPTWEMRWRALGPHDQARLAVAGLKRTSTTAAFGLVIAVFGVLRVSLEWPRDQQIKGMARAAIKAESIAAP